MKKEFMIQGMSCGGCKKNVEQLALGQKGVLSAQADLASGRTELDVNAEFREEDFRQAIEEAGFEVQ